MDNRPAEFDAGSPPKTPRWVKFFAIGFAVLLLGIAVMFVHGVMTGTGPFQHQPMGH